MRRVVTGHTESGKSVFVSDGEPPRIEIRPSGNEITEVWATPLHWKGVDSPISLSLLLAVRLSWLSAMSSDAYLERR